MTKKIKSVIILYLCIIVVVFGCMNPVYAIDPQKNFQDKEMDIVFLVDNSQTMWEKHFDNRQKDDPLLLRNNAMRVAVNVIVGSDARVGFVYFADTAYKTYDLQYVRNEIEYRDICRKYLDVADSYPTNVNTNIDEGLNSAIDRFDEISDRKKVIVLFSDGIDDISSDIVDNLLENDIELHCISINGEDEKLRQLVNYQQDSHEYDDRLTSVTPENLNALYDKFTEKFFGLRGDVRYEKVELDSDYSYSFSVPELAVSKFRLYIRGTDISAELNKVSDYFVQKADSENWNEFDHCTFMTVKNPGKSQYSLKLSSPEKENLNNVTVILAYYTDLRADVVIEPTEDVGIIRGHGNRLKIRFFDGDEKAITIDSKAVVTACADILKENQTIVSKEIPVSEKSGQYCISDIFTFDDFGDVRIRVNVSFGRNIGIDYSFDIFDTSDAIDTKIKIIPHPPETIRKYSSDTISAEKIQDGSQTKFLFTIPLEEYIRDIDSSLAEMKVSDFDNYSDNNHFTAYVKNERLVIEADTDGIINGFVELKDESGKTTKLDIEGSIKNMGDKNAFWIVILLIAVFGVLVFLILLYMKKKNKITEQPEIVKEVEEKLSVIALGPYPPALTAVLGSDIAVAVAPIFAEINYDELKSKIPTAFNGRIEAIYKSQEKIRSVAKVLSEIDKKTSKVSTVSPQDTNETSDVSKKELVQIIVDAIVEIIDKEKRQLINNAVRNVIRKHLSVVPSKEEKQEIVDGIEMVFAENIYFKHTRETIEIVREQFPQIDGTKYIGSISELSSFPSDDSELSSVFSEIGDTFSHKSATEKSEPEVPDKEAIPFSIRIKDKKRNMSYRLAKPGINEEHPWYRTLGDFDSLSGLKVRDLPEKDRPDTEIRFESGREADVPVIYVKKGNETKVVRYGETLDWLDMEIKLNK